MSEQDESIFYKTQLGVLGKLFLGTSTAKILDFLLIFREFDYSESEIAKHAGISTRHIYRAIPKLEELGLIDNTRMSGRAKMYKINSDCKAIQYLEKFVYTIKTETSDEESTVLVQSKLDKEKIPESEEVQKLMI